jgi:hypothetical protein
MLRIGQLFFSEDETVVSQRTSPMAGSYTLVALALFVAIVVLIGTTIARAGSLTIPSYFTGNWCGATVNLMHRCKDHTD